MRLTHVEGFSLGLQVSPQFCGNDNIEKVIQMRVFADVQRSCPRQRTHLRFQPGFWPVLPFWPAAELGELIQKNPFHWGGRKTKK